MLPQVSGDNCNAEGFSSAMNGRAYVVDELSARFFTNPSESPVPKQGEQQ